jgi:integrase
MSRRTETAFKAGFPGKSAQHDEVPRIQDTKVFAAVVSTGVPRTGIPEKLQKALFHAVRKAGITKRVTAHTFRHSYATHLLQANYDIHTKLGHSSLKTVMTYTHCVPVRTVKEAKSPLDLD